MPTNIPKGPLSHALSFVIGDGSCHIYDYANLDDFKRLWAFDEILSRKTIIVWSDTVPDPDLAPINAAECLSPVDWAMCYAAKHKGAPGAVARVMILDMDPKGHSRLPSIARFDSIKPELFPWLRIERDIRLSKIVEWLGEETAATKEDSSKDALSRFLGDMRASVTESRGREGVDHHAVANIIAPMILLGRDLIASPHRTALKALLEASGLINFTVSSVTKDEQEILSAESETAQSRGNEFDGVHILLVDDQEHHGWKDWVRECLPGAKIEARRHPEEMVEAIRTQMDAQPAGSKDLRFKLKLPDVSAGLSQIVLLDLRLFSGQFPSEKMFYKKNLLPLMERFADRPDLAWPSFSSADIKLARDKVDSMTAESAEHHQALTWLPRLLALADMSIPIILFSSTGLRELIQPFSEYGNIITGFRKPRLGEFGGDRDEIAVTRSNSVASFRRAVSKAQLWLRGRKVAGKVVNTNLFPLEETRRAFENKKLIEIYHDEASNTDTPYFRVVSLVVGFENIAQANDVDAAFPFRFYGRTHLSKRVAAPKDPQYREKTTKRWVDVFSGNDVLQSDSLIFAVLGKDRDTLNVGSPTSLTDPNGLDNINMDLLRLLWESILCDVLPNIIHPDAQVDIYGATRYRAVLLKDARDCESAIKKASEILRLLEAKWGLAASSLNPIVKDSGDPEIVINDTASPSLILRYNLPRTTTLPYKLLWRSLKTDSFGPIVSENMFARRGGPYFKSMSGAIRKAVGNTLSEKEKTARHLHYFADIFGDLCLLQIDSQKAQMPEETGLNLAKRKAVMSFRSRLVLILNSNRLADAKCWPEALAVFDAIPAHSDDLALLSLAERLGKELPFISGGQFGVLCALLDTMPRWLLNDRLQTPERIGHRGGLAPSPGLSEKRNLPHKAKSQDNCLSLQTHQGRPQSGATKKAQPICNSLLEIQQKWRIRRFPNGSYNMFYENIPGYQVRCFADDIVVFANTDKVTALHLKEFQVPEDLTLFDHGQPGGWPYKRSAQTR